MALELSGKAPATYEHAVLQLQRPLWERRSAGAVTVGASLRMSSRRRRRQPTTVLAALSHWAPSA